MQQEETSDRSTGFQDLDIWSGKTPESLVQTKEKTSERFLKKQRVADPTISPSICQTGKCRSILADRFSISWRTFDAQYRSTPAAAESTLSQILDTTPHPKYYLSQKACLGILRRAEARGKAEDTERC